MQTCDDCIVALRDGRGSYCRLDSAITGELGLIKIFFYFVKNRAFVYDLIFMNGKTNKSFLKLKFPDKDLCTNTLLAGV